MADPARAIQTERDNVETALSNLREAVARGDRSVIGLAAVATFVHNAYNGIEDILKQSLNASGIEVPRRDAWHKELLKTAAEQAIISTELADKLYDYLTFRHFFVHGYGFMLDETDLLTLAAELPEIWSGFWRAMEEQLKRISPGT
jgi:uncharacterized protein YutE (UPF0331/DUF86 family)